MKRLTIVLAVTLLAGWQLAAANFSSPRGMAMGGAYLTMARGVQAIWWNPANLGLKDNPKGSWGLLSVGAGIGNNSFSLGDYNKTMGDTLDAGEKQSLMDKIPSSGFGVEAGVNVHTLLDFSIYRFAFSVANVQAGVYTGIGKDAFELAMFGNELNRTYNLASDFPAEAYGVIAPTISWGQPIPLFKGSAFGLSFKYLMGTYYAGAESKATFVTDISGLNTVGTVTARTAGIPDSGNAKFQINGSGFAGDIGFVSQLTDNWTVGVSLLNISTGVTWNKEARRHDITMAIDSIALLDAAEDSIELDSLVSDTSYGIGSFNTKYPMTLNVGFSYRYKKLAAAFAYEQGFYEGANATRKPRFATGLEFRPWKWLPLRGGVSYSGRTGIGLSGGWGFEAGPWYLDFAATGEGGIGNSVRGLEAALATGFEFGKPKAVKIITDGTLAGTVVNKEDGKPMRGVAITVIDTLGKAMTTVLINKKPVPATAVTDSAGAFSLVLPAKRVRGLRAEFKGFVTKEVKVAMQPAQVTQLVVELAKVEIPRGFIAGKITDSKTGLPVRALMSFAGTEFKPIPCDTLSGQYNIGLTPGNYKVIVTAEGYNPDSSDYVVENKKTSSRDFALRLIPKKGEKFVIRGINFETGKATITDGSPLFADKDIINLPSLVVKLIDAKNNASMYLRQQLSPRSNRLLDNFSPGRTSALLLTKSLVRDFNKLCKGGVLIYTVDRFKDVKLADRTVKLMAANPTGDKLVRLNRMLIDNCYPSEILPVKPGSYELLAEASRILSENPTIKIEIGGHTDKMGSIKKNIKLSQDRADAVKQYLAVLGIDPTRMTTRGYGPALPIADNKTRQGRADNRRIEFVVTE